jgi:hypothetical protein
MSYFFSTTGGGNVTNLLYYRNVRTSVFRSVRHIMCLILTVLFEQ